MIFPILHFHMKLHARNPCNNNVILLIAMPLSPKACNESLLKPIPFALLGRYVESLWKHDETTGVRAPRLAMMGAGILAVTVILPLRLRARRETRDAPSAHRWVAESVPV